MRNSKFAARNFNSAKAGVYEVVDSCLRGLTRWAVFRVSNFEIQCRF